MAYKLKERIPILLEKALEASDISHELDALQMPTSVVETELLNERTEISRQSFSLMEEYTQLENRRKRRRQSVTNNIFITLGSIVMGIYLLFNWSQYIALLPNSFSQIAFVIAFFILIISTASTLVVRYREFQNLDKSLKTQEELIDSEILENGIKPFLRLYINNNKNASLDTTLKNKDAPGIWAIMNRTFEVSTETKKKVERMISHLSGGSIGIAGPRGVGKSTLLSTICYPKSDEVEVQPTLPVLAVITSVPVKYDSRDFVLHLYSQVCQKVLELEKDSNPLLSYVRNLVGEFPVILFIVFMIGSFGISFATAWAQQNNLFPDLQNLMQNLDITPGYIFKVSIVLIAVSFFSILLLIRNIRRTRQRHDYDDSSQPLASEARRRLDEIRYQMSFSEGWSGGLRMPETINLIESVLSYSSSKTRNPLTLPEIIDDYRKFITSLSENYKILIGIDELDKITSPEVAQQFLNETKAIFGIRNCFYLVSVSDNALSNFERRGVAFRDEFDTAFDDVLFLETPNLKYALDMLRRRVIGMPLPFVYYCYTLSGGLPRDVIRVCRDLFDIADKHPVATLEIVVRESIVFDLRSKIRAISIAATESLVEPETSLLLNTISNIDFNSQALNSWLKISEEITRALSEYRVDATDTNNKKMRKLIEELSAYLLFSATVQQYFSRMGKKRTITQLSLQETGYIEKLARAKQLITSSPAYSQSVIMNFRQWAKLDVTTETNNASNGSRKQKAGARKPADKTV